jgi:hypothetical protein
MSKKRLFQVFDEMNVNDDANKTAHLGCCYDMVEAKTAKGGGHVTMGVPAEEITKIFLGDRQPILLLLDKKEYHRLNDQPVQQQTREQLQNQIEQEADAITAKLKDNTDYQAGYSKGYEDGYTTAGGKYGIQWAAAEVQLEKMAKALEETIAIAYPNVPVLKKASQVLTDYNNYKNGKDGNVNQSVKTIEYMPVHPEDARKPDCPKQFPMHLLDEGQAQRNHSQSLNRLKERGGLSVREILAIVGKKSWSYYANLDWDKALKMLNEIILSNH